MPASESILSSFNFEVHLAQPTRSGAERLARTASFSEVSGLETTLQILELREGGFNTGARRLMGQAGHPALVFKRGMSIDTGFWDWIQACIDGSYPLPYLDGEILQHRRNRQDPPARWRFTGGIATLVKASDLAALGDAIPIEELHISHEGLRRVST